MPAVLDDIGTKTPARIYASVPRGQSIADGFRDITHGEVLRAVDALATWLAERFGVGTDFETLAYAGVGDLRYAVFFFAVVKYGYKALFISPRNPIDQNVALLTQMRCTKFFHSHEMIELGRQLQQAMGDDLHHAVEIGPFDQWIDAYTTPYPYVKSFEDARFDPVVVLHSSGSTGRPKPIVQDHEYFANGDRLLPSIPGRQTGGAALWDYEDGGYYFSPFPSYHLAGFHSLSYFPVFGRSCSLLLGFPDRPATPDMIYLSHFSQC